MMTTYVRRLVLLAGMALLAAVPARAQHGFGVRGGLSVDPDQAYIGGHVDLGPLVGSLWFRPNIEIGFGNDVTTFAFNGEVAWWFPRWKSGWRIYAGGGPALNIYDSEHGGSDSRAGLNLLMGFAHKGGFFAEVKVGAFDSPDFKLGMGFTFH
jgi:hypothetical protein